MTKVIKKISCMLIAFAMVMTMIPFVSAPVLAAENVITAYVNGVSTEKTVTTEWMEENKLDPQIFPFPSKQGGTWVYVIAEGPSYEAVIKEAYGVEDLEDLDDARLDYVGNTNGFNIVPSQLYSATSCFKLVNENDEDVVGGFKAAHNDVKAVALDGAEDVTPVMALREAEFNTYEEAKKALDENTWKASAKTDIRPYIGGNLNEDIYLKKDGSIKMGIFNFVGKFSISNSDMNLLLPTTLEMGSMKFTSTAAKQAKMPFALTDAEVDLLYGAAQWTSSDESVATVDENGNIKPAGKIGSCTVTAKMAKGNTIGKCKVTVDKSAFAPAKPGSYKVTNIKTRTAKLTWTKSARATGYRVYRYNSKTKKYTCIKTIKSPSTLYFKDTGRTKNKTYYYKIRAYREYNGTTLYSSYTTGRKVKITK